MEMHGTKKQLAQYLRDEAIKIATKLTEEGVRKSELRACLSTLESKLHIIADSLEHGSITDE